jgi:hypothetical protein
MQFNLDAGSDVIEMGFLKNVPTTLLKRAARTPPTGVWNE